MMRPVHVSNPYALLGISSNCTAEEIRAAYRKRVLETHPDKGGDPEEFRRVQQAYEVLNRQQVSDDRSRSPPKFKVDVVMRHMGPADRARMARQPQCMEEEIRSAFSNIPGKDAARPSKTPRTKGGASLSARISTQAFGSYKVPESPAKIWEKMTKMKDEERRAAMCKLDPATKEAVISYLKERGAQRAAEPAQKKTKSGSIGATPVVRHNATTSTCFEGAPHPPRLQKTAKSGMDTQAAQRRPKPTPTQVRTSPAAVANASNDSSSSASSDSSDDSTSGEDSSEGNAAVGFPKPVQEMASGTPIQPPKRRFRAKFSAAGRAAPHEVD